MSLLLVEDSETDAKLIVRELKTAGFTLDWERVDSEVALRDALERREWNVVISDSSMPSLDAIKALHMTQQIRPRTPFIAVSGMFREETAVEAIRCGAADYISKDKLHRLGPVVVRELSTRRPHTRCVPRTLLVELDARLAAGEQGTLAECRAAVGSARAILAGYLEPHGAAPVAPAAPLPTAQLTPRQLSVLQLIAGGHSTREIAQRMGLSVKTVESHRAQLLLRLRVRGVAGLVRYALRAGIAPED